MVHRRGGRFVRAVGLMSALALTAAACGSDDKGGESTEAPGTTAGATETTAASVTTGDPATTDTPGTTGGPGPSTTAAAAGGSEPAIGGAGIASDPRDIGGVFTIDDGVAVFSQRPADEDRTGVTDTEIKIGKHSPITGPLAPIAMGPMMQTWIDLVNDAGGVHGRKIVLEDRDSAANPAQATQVVRELVENEGIFAMFAGQITPAHQAVAPYLVEKGVIDWSPNSTASWVGEPPEPTRFGGLSPSAMECWIICEYMFEQFPEGKVAVIYQNDDFGNTVLVPIRKRAEEAGGEVVEISFELSASADLTSQVQQAVAAEPDAIFIMSQFPQFSAMYDILRDSLGSDIPVFVGPAGSSGFLQGMSQFDGVTSAQWSLTPGDAAEHEQIRNMLTRYQEANVTNVTVAAVALFEFESFVHALELAGPDLTREGFIEAAEIGFDGSWTCSVCFAPFIYNENDRWGVEHLQLTEWSAEKDGWEHLGEPVSFETSDGLGLRDALPDAVLEGP